MIEHRALLVLGALIVVLPVLGGDFSLDDWWQLDAIETRSPWEALRSLYAFSSMGSHLDVVWWRAEGLRLDFFRPLASGMALVNHAVYGRWAPGWHAGHLVWWLVLALTVRTLFDRAIGGRAAALAALVFVFDDGHLPAISWLAARHAIVSAVFVTLALAVHVRWRTIDGPPRAKAAEAGLWALAFLSGESALSGLGFLLAWEACREGPAKQRVLGLAPAFVVTALWAVAYKAGGYGTYGSGWYHDPVREPVAWLVDAGPRALALLGQLTLRAQVDWWLVPRLQPSMIFAGAAGAAVWAGLSWTLANDDRDAWVRARWWLLGSLLSIVPMLSTLPAGRLLVLPSLGAAAFLGIVIDHVARRRFVEPRLALPYRGFVAVWALVVGLLSPVWLFAKAWGAVAITSTTAAQAAAADLGPAGAHVVLVTTTNPLMVQAIAGQSADRRWCGALSLSDHALSLTRTAPERLEVEVIDGVIGASLSEQLFRDAGDPFAVGDTVAWGAGHVQVLAVDHGAVTRFAVVAPTDLDGPAWAWRTVDSAGVHAFALPGVGDARIVP